MPQKCTEINILLSFFSSGLSSFTTLKKSELKLSFSFLKFLNFGNGLKIKRHSAESKLNRINLSPRFSGLEKKKPFFRDSF
jgi:hypothetical protein